MCVGVFAAHNEYSRIFQVVMIMSCKIKHHKDADYRVSAEYYRYKAQTIYQNRDGVCWILRAFQCPRLDISWNNTLCICEIRSPKHILLKKSNVVDFQWLPITENLFVYAWYFWKSAWTIKYSRDTVRVLWKQHGSTLQPLCHCVHSPESASPRKTNSCARGE